jgi:hypothetical protein
MVASLDTGDAIADFLNNRSALVTEDCRENSFRILALTT